MSLSAGLVLRRLNLLPLRSDSSLLLRPARITIQQPPRISQLLPSDCRTFANKPLQQKPKSAEPTPTEEPDYPKFSLADLGAGRKVKLVVITVLTILGTIESVFWVKMLWAKFGPSEKEEGSTTDAE